MNDNIIPSIILHPGELAQFPLNANSHPPAQIDELVASRERFSQYRNVVGWRCPQDTETQTADGKPVTLKKGVMYVIAGNGFHQASVKRQDGSIEVKDYSHLSLDEAILLAETDNAAPLGAQRLVAQLQANLERARGLYQDDERMRRMFDRLKAQAGVNGKGTPPESMPPPIDKAAELQEIWQVQPGQIWQAGQHFIICGDCRDGDTWKRLLGAAGIEKAQGVFTSPPYAEQRKAQYGGVPTDKYVEWWEAVQGNVRENLAGDGSFFVNIKPHCEGGQRVLYVFDLVLAMVRVWGWRFVDELCWTHQGFPGGWENRFKNGFEPIYHFSVNDIKFNKHAVATEPSESYHKNKKRWEEGYRLPETASQMTNAFNTKYNMWELDTVLPNNVLNIQHGEINQGLQAAVFPVALPTFFLKAYSDPGDVWLDPFCGSGTTIVAAHNEGRVGLGIEALPKYVSVICERLKALGLTPTLIDQGAR